MRNKLVDNRYRIVARIGQGAMGKVYRAEHVYTRRPVALKIIHPQYQKDEKYRVRFLREIELACRIHHPNAVQILDAGETESGVLYMAMEFLDGHTLSNVLKLHPEGLDLDDALFIAYQIGQALEAVHDAGLVHRDLKPDNIMVLAAPGASLKKSVVKILDFGIARDIDDANSLTGKMMIGTPKFMSPEQTRGEKLTQQSDIYNLGLVLYAMLTGKEPFTSDSPVGYVFHHNMTQPEPVSTLRSDVPANIEWAIQKALSKDPAERFDSVERFIKTIVVGQSGFKKNAWGNRDPHPFKQDVQARSGHRVLKAAMLMAFVFVAIIVGAIFFLSRSQESPAFANTPEPFDPAFVHRMAADTIEIIYRDSMMPMVITPEWGEMANEGFFEDEEEPAFIGPLPPPVLTPVQPELVEVQDESSDPVPTEREQTTQQELIVEEEIDPNLLYNTDVRAQAIERAGIGDAGEKPIEENSNLVRLREQNQKNGLSPKAASAKKGDSKKDEANTALTANAFSPNALPRVKGGVKSLHEKIRYPADAVTAGATGTVAVRALIDENGIVKEVQITQSVGYGCDEEVLRVVKEAEFEPARLENEPIKAWLNLQFSFQLVQ